MRSQAALAVLLGAYTAVAVGHIRENIRDVVSKFDFVNDISTHDESSSTRVHLASFEPGEAHPARLRVSFSALGRNFSIIASRQDDIFADSYAQVHMSADGRILSGKRGKPRCHYSGYVEGTDRLAHFSTCGGVLHAYIKPGRQGGSAFEVVYSKEDQKHVAFDHAHHKPRRPFKCTVGEDHKHESHHDDHHHDGDDHENHHHGDGNPLAHAPSLLSAGECTGGPTKYVDVIIFNDNSHFQKRGIDTEQHSAIIFAYTAAAYYGGNYSGSSYGGITGTGFDCRVQLRLIGQLTFRNGDPSGITYDVNCSSCSAGETDDDELLQSFSDWSSNNRAGLEGIYGDIDNFMLFTDHDFAGSTIGKAWVGTMCRTSTSANINMVDSASAAYSAGIVAHEMGHNFKMSHDSGGSDIMAPSAQNPPATEFSDTSRGYIQSYFESDYGGYWTPKCLDTDRGEGLWDDGICGNGLVEGSEQCDPGFGVNDTCCHTHNCTLKAGCECGNSQVCCTGGAFRPSTYMCRSAVSSTCDTAEYCTGALGDCPADQFGTAGTSCSKDIWGRTGVSGQCYKGKCVTADDGCSASYTYQFDLGGAAADRCNNMYCRNNPGGGGYSYMQMGPAPAGTPCGGSSQCVATSRSCVASSTLKFYHWYAGNNGCATPICRDEAGTNVSSSNCEDDAPTAPPVCGLPTAQPTEFPTPYPSPAPTDSPTPAPTDQPTPATATSSPTDYPTAGPTQYPTPAPSSAYPTAYPTGYPTPGSGPTNNPTPTPPTNFPTPAPTHALYKVDVKLQMSFTQVNTTFESIMLSRVAGALGVPTSSLQISFEPAAEVIMRVYFVEPYNSQSTQDLATTWSMRTPTQMNSDLGLAANTVLSASDPDEASSGGSSGGTTTTDASPSTTESDNSGVVMGLSIALVAVVMISGWIICYYRGKASNGMLHSRNLAGIALENMKEHKVQMTQVGKNIPEVVAQRV